MQLKIRHILILLLAVGYSCTSKQGDLFINPSSDKTGLAFENTIESTEDLNILDYLYFYNGGGVAVGDINNDGLPDIYLSGNQVQNKLYLNKGNLKFEDITESAGVAGKSDWNTGTIMADVNGDGLLDIYVCAVVGLKGFNGHNELFINNGDNTFTEEASTYGLDFDTYSSNAAFFDFDLDGDLDMFLLNHAVHTEKSFGRVDLRYERNYETGDRMLRNDDGKFVDISEEAGIYGGINAYGLGLAISDINVDGYPDIYVGNDFHEDDYLYLNNGNGTFTESLKKYMGHTSRFSMGNDIADINHDGLPDLISLDMLPENEMPLKASEGDDNIQTQKMRIEQFGYHYQFTRNMLFINQPDGHFLETALLSGIAATDWSWSALFGDYDQDGEEDLFISNGIPKRPNDLDFIKFVSSEQIQNKIENTKLVDKEALKLMPTGNVGNYIFKGDGNLGFEDRSDSWQARDTLISGATAYADFDNDGDLDLITNNLNEKARFYINKTDNNANYLKLRFKFSEKNTFGIGTKIYAYNQGKLTYKELQPVRGFQASSEPFLHLGLGTTEKLDSLKIVWPNGTKQSIRDITANQSLVISPKNAVAHSFEKPIHPKKLFVKDTSRIGIHFTHVEDNYVDFNREKLIPYKISDRGPAYAKGDLNNDGKMDLFFGGSKFFPSQIFIGSDNGFVKTRSPEIDNDSVKEQVSATIFDANQDGENDLIVGVGGGNYFGQSNVLTDNYYSRSDDSFSNVDLPATYKNTSVTIHFDFDQDGDLDLFIGGYSLTGKFGQPITSQLLINDKGTFSLHQEIEVDGFVTNAIWNDFDQDGQTDLILVGEWMSPTFLKNNKGRFEKKVSPKINGLWQSIAPFDIDHDGDTDYLLGNWGLNSKFKASEKFPMLLYYDDFDENGSTETILAVVKNGTYFTLATLDDLAGQMVFLRKKFPNYKSFAGKSIDEIFDQGQLKEAKVLEVTNLQSGYLKNDNGEFTFIPLATQLQLAPIIDFIAHDFDGDGSKEVLAGGNYFGVKPYHGRFDSFPGALIHNENEIVLGNVLGLDFTQKSVRHLDVITHNENEYLLVVFNNEDAQLYSINK